MGCTDEDVAGESPSFGWSPSVTRLVKDSPKIDTVRIRPYTDFLPSEVAGPKPLGYKIRRRSDGRFSTGGSHPTFSPRGKTWGSLGDLHGHFACVREYASWNLRQNRIRYYGDPVAHLYDGCDLVTLVESEKTPIEKHILEMKK